ncbi:AraC family transcriptional regulator [uncultured Polaribacter sp.]|uniref:helix-turn-helix domain-containing protein n=1 Tax=uncultured Polaribacter sp. TaxID=174711 RepID=UPI0026231913|nr:helix-turn-helix domain-containing protein [uncultured Polaribacter sp.]
MANEDKLEMYGSQGLNDPIWIVLLFSIYVAFYILKIFGLNRKLRKKLLNEYANNEIELKLFSNQLVFLASILTITIPLSLCLQYLSFDTQVIDKLPFLLFSLIPHVFLFYILRFRETRIVTIEKEETVNGSLNIDIDSYKSNLLDFMNKYEPYLNKELKLQDLASFIGWSRSTLSYVINKGFDKNFYDFVNEYRLNFATQEINNAAYKKYSLDYIAAESGFKNYVSFYRIFRRYKGTSPKTFIKEIENKN